MKLTVGKVMNAVSVISAPNGADFDASIGEVVNCGHVLYIRDEYPELRAVFPDNVPDEALASFVDVAKSVDSHNPANKTKAIIESGVLDEWLGRGVQAMTIISKGVDTLAKLGVFHNHQ